MRGEGEAIGGFLDALRRRLARSVARARVDPDERRGRTALGGLERRRELEGMAGDDAIIMITGGDERRRIRGARLQVVQR
jgi:hypothetical protein